jgi:hypothetical protein
MDNLKYRCGLLAETVPQHNKNTSRDAERPWEAKCGVYILEGNDGGAITAREHFDFKVRCANR